MSSSGFRLPCLYCKEETTFESSQLLKEHLLSDHGELVSTGKDGLGSSDRMAKVASRAAEPPPSYCQLSDELRTASSATLFSRKLQQKETPPSPSNLRLIQLNDIISRNGDEWQRLCEANERRKSVGLREGFQPKLPEPVSRDSEPTQNTFSSFDQNARVAEDRVFRNNEILQLKLREFESIISKHRATKSANESQASKLDVTVQDSVIGKRGMLGVESREREMAVGKEAAGSPTSMTESPLFLKMRTLATSSGTSMSPDKDESRFAEVKVKEVKLEDNILTSETVLGRIEDTSSILPPDDDEAVEKEAIVALKQELEKEKEANAALTKSLQDALDQNVNMKDEMQMKESLKGKKSDPEAAAAASVTAALAAATAADGSSRKSLEVSNPEILSLVRSVEEENQNLSSKLHVASETQANLLERVKSLHAEKEKLVENLKKADGALREISGRVNAAEMSAAEHPSSRENSKLLERVNKQLKANLSQIANMVRQIPTKEQISSREQVSHLKDEVHRVTLLLAQEKMSHDQLKKSSTELEETVKLMSDCEDQKEAMFAELNALRSKHKKCVLVESALKQSKREKKTLQKKHENLRRKFDLLNVLDQTIQDSTAGLSTSTDGEEGNRSSNEEDALPQLQKEIAEKDQIIREYECDHRSLMEKNESTLDELVKVREELGQRSQRNGPDSNSNVEKTADRCKKFEQMNAELSRSLATAQADLESSQNELEVLQGKINALEIGKLQSESVIASLRASLESNSISKEREMDKPEHNKKYSTMMENLSLERDILSSRVLILEGIGDEVEILKGEKEKLKKMNEELKSKLVESNIVTARTSLGLGGEPASDSLITVKDFSATIDQDDNNNKKNNNKRTQKPLSNLDDREKARLQMMLSNPYFDPTSVTDYLAEFDLPSSYGTDDDAATAASQSDRASDGEYVQNIHAVDTESDGESTINYAGGDAALANQDSKGKLPTLCEGDEYGNGSVDRAEAKKSSSKKKKLLNLGRLRKGRKAKKLLQKDSPISMYNDSEAEPNSENVTTTTATATTATTATKKESGKSVDTIKHVKFSDDLLIEAEAIEDDAIVQDAMIKSYYQECLEREYPTLADDRQLDLDDTSGGDSPRSTTSEASPPRLLNLSTSRCGTKSRGFSYNKCDLGYESHASNLNTLNNDDDDDDDDEDLLEKAVEDSEYQDMYSKFDNSNFVKREASEALKVLQSLVDVSAENEFPESEDCDNDIMEKKGAKRKRFFALKTSKTEALIRELNSRFGIQDNMTSTPLSSKI